MDPMMVSQGVLNLYELEEPKDEMLRVNNTKTLRRRFDIMITEPWMLVAMMAGDLGSQAAIGHLFSRFVVAEEVLGISLVEIQRFSGRRVWKASSHHSTHC